MTTRMKGRTRKTQKQDNFVGKVEKAQKEYRKALAEALGFKKHRFSRIVTTDGQWVAQTSGRKDE